MVKKFVLPVIFNKIENKQCLEQCSQKYGFKFVHDMQETITTIRNLKR